MRPETASCSAAAGDWPGAISTSAIAMEWAACDLPQPELEEDRLGLAHEPACVVEVACMAPMRPMAPSPAARTASFGAVRSFGCVSERPCERDPAERQDDAQPGLRPSFEQDRSGQACVVDRALECSRWGHSAVRPGRARETEPGTPRRGRDGRRPAPAPRWRGRCRAAARPRVRRHPSRARCRAARSSRATIAASPRCSADRTTCSISDGACACSDVQYNVSASASSALSRSASPGRGRWRASAATAPRRARRAPRSHSPPVEPARHLLAEASELGSFVTDVGPELSGTLQVEADGLVEFGPRSASTCASRFAAAWWRAARRRLGCWRTRRRG